LKEEKVRETITSKIYSQVYFCQFQCMGVRG